MASKGDAVQNLAHNQRELGRLRDGDLVEFKRGAAYSHWGVYIGDEEIIHLWADDTGDFGNFEAAHMLAPSGVRFDKAKVRRDPFWTVVGEDLAYRNNTKDSNWTPLPADEIVRNAFEKLGKVGYSILWENCEHFAKWCRYGIAKSDQVDNVLTGLAVGAAGALVVGVVHAVAKFWGNKEDEKERKEEL